MSLNQPMTENVELMRQSREALSGKWGWQLYQKILMAHYYTT